MQYGQTLLKTGLSRSEFFNLRQIHTRLDILVPSPAHAAHERQA